jgi:flavin-dependent dehydrogenase
VDRCDALVVGGGPAGSSCAWWLSRAGLDVQVLDKQSFPRDKVCAGWVTPAVFETLGIDTGEYPRELVLQPITGFRTGLLGAAALDTDYDRVVSYGIRRCEFDHYLLQRSGARLTLGEPLRELQRRNGLWRVNEHIETPLVIGAGGHFCPVARTLGARPGRGEMSVAAREIEFATTSGQRRACDATPERPELYFCPDLKGYGWLFRKGEYLNIGLGREDGHRLAEQTAAFCEFLRRSGRVADTGRPQAFKGHAYQLYGHGQRRLLDDGVLLIGDAAGLACPQSGEGIRPAVESGILAAQTILAAGGDYRASNLESYRRQLTVRFGTPRPPAGSRLARLRAVIGSRLLGSARFTRHVLLDRWFLHRGQPVLSPASRERGI